MDVIYKGCGSGSGGIAWSGELGAGDDLGGLAPAVSDAEAEVIQIATAQAIVEHAAKSRGTTPAGLLAKATAVLAPSVTPWQQVLAATVRRTVARKMGSHDTDYARRNRRKHNACVRTTTGPRKVVYPGYVSPIPKVALVRDTSGSMSATDLAMVSREVEAISKKMGIRDEDLTITDVDARAYGAVRYRGRSSIETVRGRGGTDMCVGIEALWAEKKNRPTVIVVATDGYTPWPRESGPVPVVACIVTRGDVDDAPETPEWIRRVVVNTGL
jgi:predicted metal-dependent peptidase